MWDMSIKRLTIDYEDHPNSEDHINPEEERKKSTSNLFLWSNVSTKQWTKHKFSVTHKKITKKGCARKPGGRSLRVKKWRN